MCSVAGSKKDEEEKEMKREIKLPELIEKICELDGFCRGYFSQSQHDYKRTLDDLKAIIKREMKDD